MVSPVVARCTVVGKGTANTTLPLKDFAPRPSAANTKPCDPHLNSDVSRDDSDRNRVESENSSCLTGHEHDLGVN